MKKRIDFSRINKILLIRLRVIGDIVTTTPAVTVLRKNFPQAFISYVVEFPYLELVEGNPNINEVIVLDRKSSWSEFREFIKKIRSSKYDLAIDFHGGPRASLITLLSGAKIKVGFKVKYRNIFYHFKVPRGKENGHYHSVESHLNLIKSLGIRIDKIPPLLLPSPSQQEKERIDKFLRDNNLFASKNIVLHISAGNQYREWGIDNLARLVNLFSKKSNLKIILIGNKKDKEIEKELMKKIKFQPLSLVGQLSLRELRELIAQSDLFIGSDGGPMHIAASTNTPIVVFFGPTIPAIFGPWQAKAKIIEKEFDCRPCRQKKCIYQDFRCLRTISPEEVYQASLEFLR
ncbi:MAG: glycosyltransferase family 9 protein [Candidatus Aminicenantia bacterium]